MEARCPKCQSSEVVDDVRVDDRGESNVTRSMRLTVYQKPGAVVFKGRVHSDVKARVCGSCGYVELFATDPAVLLEAARVRTENR